MMIRRTEIHASHGVCHCPLRRIRLLGPSRWNGREPFDNKRETVPQQDFRGVPQLDPHLPCTRSGKLLEERLCLLQVKGIEPFGEPAIAFGEHRPGFGLAALF
jgi:hypothetical protein